MLLDEEVISDLENRASLAMLMPYVVEGDKSSVDFVRGWMEELDFQELFEQMLNAVQYGFQPIEVNYQRDNGTLIPTSTQCRNPWGFVIGRTGDIIANPYNGIDQYVVPKGKIIPTIRKPSIDKPYGQSVLEELWPIWQSKWIGWSNIERLGQKYAIPSVVALLGDKVKVSDDSQLAAVASNLAALENGDSTAITADKIEVLNPQGKVKEILETIEYIDKKINKRITGQVLANSTQSNGNRALGEVHERMAMRIAMADAKMVFKVLNSTIFKWAFLINKRQGSVKIRLDTDKIKELFLSNETTSVELSDSLNNKAVSLCI